MPDASFGEVGEMRHELGCESGRQMEEVVLMPCADQSRLRSPHDGPYIVSRPHGLAARARSR